MQRNTGGMGDSHYYLTPPPSFLSPSPRLGLALLLPLSNHAGNAYTLNPRMNLKWMMTVSTRNATCTCENQVDHTHMHIVQWLPCTSEMLKVIAMMSQSKATCSSLSLSPVLKPTHDGREAMPPVPTELTTPRRT